MTEAFVTLATNDAYGYGALVLGRSLRRVNTTKKLAVLITNQVNQQIQTFLHEIFDEVVIVDVLDSRDSVNLGLLGRPDLAVTFTKFHCWRLTQFEKCVFMDADTLVLHNIDELFEREELSAAPDPGWPDCFNSGVFVFRPNVDTYKQILNAAVTLGSFDGGDQGLLNLFFSDWAYTDIKKHLPFVYNVVARAFYSYLPAMKQFGAAVKVVHFIGERKPWSFLFNRASGSVVCDDHTQNIDWLGRWWNIFINDVCPRLQQLERAGVAPKTPLGESWPGQSRQPLVTASSDRSTADGFGALGHCERGTLSAGHAATGHWPAADGNVAETAAALASAVPHSSPSARGALGVECSENGGAASFGGVQRCLAATLAAPPPARRRPSGSMLSSSLGWPLPPSPPPFMPPTVFPPSSSFIPFVPPLTPPLSPLPAAACSSPPAPAAAPVSVEHLITHADTDRHSADRFDAWSAGHIDYSGRDNFEKTIQSKLQQSLAEPPKDRKPIGPGTPPTERASPPVAAKVERVSPPVAAKVERVSPPVAAKVERVSPPVTTKVERVSPPVTAKVERASLPVTAKVERVSPPTAGAKK